MKSTKSAWFAARTLFVLATGLLLAGCSLGEVDGNPPLLGPSEFATSVTLSATPDQLPRDGSSQSAVTVTVRDASGQPVAGQRLSVAASLGSLSHSEVVTGSDGRATFAFTAPASSVIGNSAIIEVVPVGDNADNAVPRKLSILFTGTSNATAPVASFTFSPTAPEVQQIVTFDASATTDEGGPCGSACTYAWNFGDGTTGSGRVVTHRYTIGRIHTVTLTVVDAAGVIDEDRQTISVSQVNAPTVSLSVSPVSPAVEQQATFTATATAAPGHSVQTWAWDFGDGTTQTTSGPTVSHAFSTTGSHGVSVTVTDDLGQTGRASLSVTVTSGIAFPAPAFTVSPTAPTIGQTVSFNASGITAVNGATIVEYLWNFGDNTPEVSSASSSTSHDFATAQTFVVRLTVTDSEGRTATITRDVTVSP